MDNESWIIVGATWDGVKPEAYQSHLRLALYTARMHTGPLDWLCQPRKPIAAACTEVIGAALKAGTDWILYLDDDVVPPADAMVRLREAANEATRPVVSALATFRTAPYWPSIFETQSWGERKSVARPMPVMDWPENECIEVFGTGLCATLVHKSVFERIGRPWFAQTDDFTPDGWFFLQCQRANVPIHCHTGVQVGHLATEVATPDSYRIWCRHHGGPEAARALAVAKWRTSAFPPVDEINGDGIGPGEPGWLESLPAELREQFSLTRREFD